jgi:uncharacterized repeat protein (TIGR01451 family)
MSKTVCSLLVLLLSIIAGTRGDAHRLSRPEREATDPFGQRLVRHRLTVARSAVHRPSRIIAQSASNAVAQRVARARFERWFAKANGDERSQPIDAMPQSDRRDPNDDEGGFSDPDQGGPAGTQSELSIAVDVTGQHIVVAMNDFRGFSLNPASISGFAFSDDGGVTFTDGGQLPITVQTSILFGQTFPQVFGDPEVKYLGGSTFVYFSLVVSRYGANGLVQTLGVHRSTDYGHTWSGPFEIPAATNPSGGADINGDAVDAADKEFADVDPDTGRVIVSWSNFTPVAAGGVEISATYSDDLRTAVTPTWAPRRVISAGLSDGQGSVPRFAGNGSPNAYIAWNRFPGFYTNRIAFARSTDNGVTWSAPVELTTSFLTMDEVLGNDRVNTNPSVAVDESTGPYSGSVYVVYSNNNSQDGADVSFRRSTDGGVTFSAAVALNSRPGADRAQWFPWITVDSTTGRVYVSYYDQGIATSGDLTETTYLYSDNGGTTWHKPMPVTDRPFRAGYGNDTSQPNLGDYNQAVAQGNELFVVWAGNPALVGFADGQPSTQMTVPDVFFKRAPLVKASLRLGSVVANDTAGNGNGFIDAGEEIRLTVPLQNYVTNPLSAAPVSAITATLSSPTPGVNITQGVSAFPSAAPGAIVTNTTDYVLKLLPTFVPGSRIELELNVSSSDGSTRLLHTLPTGTPAATVLLSENFDGVSAPALPAGWVAAHGAGANSVPWRTSATFNSGNNGAFHANANDGPSGGSPARWERLFSPVFNVPVNSDYVTVDLDVKYDTEDDPVLKTLAYDGLFLRITDQTPGRTLRSVLAEAFAEEFTTDTTQHYPKHFPRSNDPSYFEDMSAWAGDSGGIKHVHLKLPGMAGSRAQLRFEFAQDGSATCADVRPGHTCGVLVDNIVVRSIVAVQADLSISKTGSPGVLSGRDMTYVVVTTNNGSDPLRNTAANVTVRDTLPAGTAFLSQTTPAGWSCTSPPVGSGGTVECSKGSVAPSEVAAFAIAVKVACAVPDGTAIQNTATVNAAGSVDPDQSNNVSSWTTAVSNPPPVISGLAATPAQLWPPNHKLVDVTVAYAVSDNCGTVTTALTVTSSEPISGTTPDWIVVDRHLVRLRAERAGDGPGRTYTITVTATNDEGGTSSSAVDVFVPHDLGR